MARKTVGIIAIIYDKLSVYPKVLSCCCMTPSMTSAVNNVIGINESHRITTSGKLTREIIINGIILTNNTSCELTDWEEFVLVDSELNMSQ